MKKYEKIKKIDKQEFLVRQYSVSIENLTLLLYGISEVEDWKWVQDIYCKYLNHDDKMVVIASIKGLSEIARINKKLDKKRCLLP